MKLFTDIFLLTFVGFLNFQRATGMPNGGYVTVDMEDSSIYQGVFSELCRDTIPNWMQPGGALLHHNVTGFIRTRDNQQSETNWIMGPQKHYLFLNGPTKAKLLFENYQYHVSHFDTYVPDGKPLNNHFYVIVPGGVYFGNLESVNPREGPFSLTPHLSVIGAARWPDGHEGYVSIKMQDLSMYEGVFTGSCTTGRRPKWLYPGGAHSHQHVTGYIRTTENEQSETNWLIGPHNHNLLHYRPAGAQLSFKNDRWYRVTRFLRYVPNEGQLFNNHFYVIVPSGIYSGPLETCNPPQERLSVTSHSTAGTSSGTSRAH